MSWFRKNKASVDASEKKTLGRGVFRKCESCGATLRADEFSANLEVCPTCDVHYHISGEAWIDLLFDPRSFEEFDAELKSSDPLKFVDSKPYAERSVAAIRKTGVNDAIMTGRATLLGRPLEVGIFLFHFMGGSMGSVVGEKLARAFERGAERKEPVIILSASGGARMQEGVLSLMQMAKAVAALGKLRAVGAPFISVLLNPTTGGVAASYALLGDINVAEPGALIGFAGPRVIEQTIGEKLPGGFQRAEFLLEHGMVDVIARRHDMRATLGRLLSHLLD